VIEESDVAGFITDMHAGFFGVTDFGVVPFTAEETRYHLSWQYENFAKSSFAYLYALAGLLAVRSHLSEHDDLFVQALACTSVFISPSEILENTDGVDQVAASYDMSPNVLAKKLAQIMHKYLPAAQEKLDSWSVATAVEMKGLEKSEARNYQYALLNMSIALERIAEYRSEIDHQIDDCADVVYWAGLLGQSSLVNVYQDKLVELYKVKGDLRAAIHSLIEKGNAYRSAGDRESALKTLSQAQSLAKEVRDPSLLKQVEIFLSVAKFLRQVK
jgi:tetratricopeptide (TPR) repeat protein